ncbi:MAG: Flp pilus assembly protein CpaB [Bacteroidales bacterium]
MNSRVILRIVAILGLGVVAALLLRSMFAAPAETRVAMSAVRTATAQLPVGTLIRAEDLAWREVPEKDIKKGEIGKDTTQALKLTGAVVRRAIEEGAVITDRDVVFPDAPGFLAAALQPGMRAVSVAIDDVTGNAGLILPGDRVDLLLTHQIAASGDDGAPSKVASETVLADVRVIAVGQALRAPDAEAGTPPATTASNARTVTLEVSPRDAESVAVVSRLGHLSLALRSLAVVRPNSDNAAAPAVQPEAPVWGKDVSQVVRMAEPKRAPRSTGGGPAAPATVQVFRGSTK